MPLKFLRTSTSRHPYERFVRNYTLKQLIIEQVTQSLIMRLESKGLGGEAVDARAAAEAVR